MGTLAIAAETPSVVATGESVSVNKTIVQTHSAMDAAVMPDVALAIFVPPGDPFDAKEVHWLHFNSA